MGNIKGCCLILKEFEDLKRNPSEPVANFIRRFNNLYKKMPLDCKPPVTASSVRFSKAFEDDFVVMLSERKSQNSAYMETNAIEVEANSSTFSKMKAKEENVEKRMKTREEGTSSSKNKDEEHKIDQINS